MICLICGCKEWSLVSWNLIPLSTIADLYPLNLLLGEDTLAWLCSCWSWACWKLAFFWCVIPSKMVKEKRKLSAMFDCNTRLMALSLFLFVILYPCNMSAYHLVFLGSNPINEFFHVQLYQELLICNIFSCNGWICVSFCVLIIFMNINVIW